MGHEVECGSWIVLLTSIGQPNANNVSPASLSIYYDSVLTNTSVMQPQSSATFNSSGQSLIVTVSQTSLGLYSYQEWAMIKLSFPSKPAGAPGASSGGGGALPGIPSGYGAPGPSTAVSKSSTSCYSLTNIAERSPFTVSIGGQSIGMINSYIDPSVAGVTINDQRYQLSLNQPFKIPGTNVTITLTSVSLQSTVSTASFEACGPSIPFVPPSQRSINITYSISPFNIINESNSSVYTYNVPANLPMAPNGFRILAIANISTNSLQYGIMNLTAQFNCSLKGVEPFILSENTWTWNPLNYSYRNSSTPTSCAARFSVPSDPVIAIMQNLKYAVPEVPTGNQTNSTGTSKKKPISINVIIAAIAIAIGAILLAIAFLRKDERDDRNQYLHNDSESANWAEDKQKPDYSNASVPEEDAPADGKVDTAA